MRRTSVNPIIRFFIFCIVLPVCVTTSAAEIPLTPVPGTSFEQHKITDERGREITYYISRPKMPAPLLVMIQGSGCIPIMHLGTDSTYSTLFNFLPFGKAGDFAVLGVEKPYSAEHAEGNPGSAEACTKQFNDDFNAETWLMALRASITSARRLNFVDRKRTLVFGVSEGAVMAALVAGHDSQVSDVIQIGGSGTTQLFDFFASAYRHCFDISVCLARIEKQEYEIAEDPNSSTKFAWGHPYKRWVSFFRVDPAEELLRSSARFYIAFGTEDQSVSPLSPEVEAAKLMAAGRDVTIRRVPNADHSLMGPGGQDFSGPDKEFRDALAWFWNKR